MCWSEKCCFCVRLDLGCLWIGITSMILSVALSITSVIFVVAELDTGHLSNHRAVHTLVGLFHLDGNLESKELIFGLILVVSLLWNVFSWLLIFGVKLNKSSFVLSYFAFGVFITFFAMLSSLLLLLQSAWIISFILIGASMVYIHFLVAVHTLYELQVRGKIYPDTSEDNNLLIENLS